VQQKEFFRIVSVELVLILIKIIVMVNVLWKLLFIDCSIL